MRYFFGAIIIEVMPLLMSGLRHPKGHGVFTMDEMVDIVCLAVHEVCA